MSILREGTLAGHTDAVLCLSSQPSVAPTAANTSKRRGKGKGRQPQKKQCDTDCRTHTTLLCSGSDDGTLKLWDVHQHLLIDSVACSSRWACMKFTSFLNISLPTLFVVYVDKTSSQLCLR